MPENNKQDKKKPRIGVMALLTSSAGNVALAIKTNGPEPNRMDLPGGGLRFGELLLDGLKREIKEEIGLEPGQFEINDLLLVEEGLFPEFNGGLHSVSIIYRCSTDTEPNLHSAEPETAQPSWLRPDSLTAAQCSVRCWRALVHAGFIKTHQH